MSASPYEFELMADQELPAIPLNWLDGARATIDFSTGWTANVKVARASAPLVTILPKTTGITLAATAPNYVIDWSIADLTTIIAAAPPGTLGVTILVYAYCKRTGDTKDREFRPGSPILGRVYPAPS